jgi:hypothetical protein
LHLAVLIGRLLFRLENAPACGLKRGISAPGRGQDQGFIRTDAALQALDRQSEDCLAGPAAPRGIQDSVLLHDLNRDAIKRAGGSQ